MILQQPYTREQLERLWAASRDGRVAAVVAVRWWWLLGQDEGSLEEALASQLTGCRVGLIDLTIRLVGSLGDDLLLEVEGDPADLLADYDRLIEREHAIQRGDLLFGVNIPVVATRAAEQFLAAGLDSRPRGRGMLRQRPDRGGIGLSDDRTQFLDSSPAADLSEAEVRLVQDTVWQQIEGGLKSREGSCG
ncbi:MAG: hypothetical protein JWO38_7378 [Gemmataceae bacterium]|nr:hypothetical protein [Gemmataceae bacterium]